MHQFKLAPNRPMTSPGQRLIAFDPLAKDVSCSCYTSKKKMIQGLCKRKQLLGKSWRNTHRPQDLLSAVLSEERRELALINLPEGPRLVHEVLPRLFHCDRGQDTGVFLPDLLEFVILIEQT